MSLVSTLSAAMPPGRGRGIGVVPRLDPGGAGAHQRGADVGPDAGTVGQDQIGDKSVVAQAGWVDRHMVPLNQPQDDRASLGNRA